MEQMCCDLEVDVNGEQTFIVDKKTVCLYSRRLRQMFGKSTPGTKNLKLIFQKFPGGPESFELVSRFCYNCGRIDITPQNITLLHSAAHFMDMTGSVSRTDNLIEQTQRFLKNVKYWTWLDLLAAMKQCQELLSEPNISAVLDICLDSLVARIESSIEPSVVSSSESRVSFDTKSIDLSRGIWWFEDLLFLKPEMLKKTIRSMLSHNLDQNQLSKFLFYYQKSKFCATNQEKHEVVETVIDLLYSLDHSLVRNKSLFGVLRVCLGAKISKCGKKKLEVMIGSQMDRSRLDDLLVPSPSGANYLYDVDLVLRLVKAFLRGRSTPGVGSRMKKVGSLIDMFMAEVAPDPCLKPSKFVELATALPNSARDSSDEIYHAIAMYLEVHAGTLSKEEKMKLCCAVDYKKLSPELRRAFSQNTKFPSMAAVSLSQPFDDRAQMIVPYGRELDRDTEKLEMHLEGMKCRVMELEKLCRKMQTQMGKMTKSKGLKNGRNLRSVPKFCS